MFTASFSANLRRKRVTHVVVKKHNQKQFESSQIAEFCILFLISSICSVKVGQNHLLIWELFVLLWNNNCPLPGLLLTLLHLQGCRTLNDFWRRTVSFGVNQSGCMAVWLLRCHRWLLNRTTKSFIVCSEWGEPAFSWDLFPVAWEKEWKRKRGNGRVLRNVNMLTSLIIDCCVGNTMTTTNLQNNGLVIEHIHGIHVKLFPCISNMMWLVTLEMR